MLCKAPPRWSIPERDATPEAVFQNRRELIGRLVGAGIAGVLAPPRLAYATTPKSKIRPKTGGNPPGPAGDLYPARRNEAYALDGRTTPEAVTSRHNVFDEFSLERGEVWKAAARFFPSPWRIHVGGAVEKPLVFEIGDLIRKMGVEERLYRFRCVETWAMAVPWTGFPFRRFLDLVAPQSAARYVRMVTAALPDEMPGWFAGKRVFPYYEALSLEEAHHDLAFLATGIYGHPLPPQHGAPLRLVVPWKYGLKGIKSIVAFELTRERPGTFWNELAPHHYSFESNVDPTSPGQEEETVLDTGEKRKTTPFNGYADVVAHLYPRA